MVIINEYAYLSRNTKGITDAEFKQLRDFAIANQYDKQGKHRPILQLRNDTLRARNYVGIITTKKGTVLEILPKIDLSSADDNKKTKKIFLTMLRTWRGLSEAQFNINSNISALHRFNMLEVFVRLFLENLVVLIQRGMARHYVPVEDNLSCLKGRILFPQHIRANSTNHARFYVRYDEFSANRPANRLIHSTIHKLIPLARQPENQQLLHQLGICFSDIPLSEQWYRDWDRHSVDRSMQHYHAVMQWVGLFLFGSGLTTFAGEHLNQSLLFPMEEIFEDFVTYHFRRNQHEFGVKAQGPQEPLALLEGKNEAFYMKPDISLTSNENPNKVIHILDTKWKRIEAQDNDPKRGINQADMYQLYSYGKKYGCKRIALIYPRTNEFKAHFHYHLDENLNLLCFPFDLTKPEYSVNKIIRQLTHQSPARTILSGRTTSSNFSAVTNPPSIAS